MPTETKKKPLRTAGDVISRLRWSHEADQDHASILIGYSDRIVGPMEKSVKDFVSASQGGDIPEHRILYFRSENDRKSLEEQILWDRAGRVDRIFGSGNGSEAPIARETLDAAQLAMANMIRIEEEQQERRKQKAKERARRARRRQLIASREGNLIDDSVTEAQQQRFQWSAAAWHVWSYRDDSWTTGEFDGEYNEPELVDGKDGQDLVSVTCVTWNVLFDLFDDGLEEKRQSCDEDSSHLARWKLLCSILGSTGADLMALQEATPSFVNVLLDSDWAKREYASSAAPTELQSVTPCGVLLLWRRSTMRPLSKDCALFQCSDFGRNRSQLATLVSSKSQNDTVLAFAAAHLPADKAVGCDASNVKDKLSRKTARKRELDSILGQFQRIERFTQKSGKRDLQVVPIIAGDFNCEDDELVDGCFAINDGSRGFYHDVWSLAGGSEPGWTFDPSNNPRAARSCQLVGGSRRSKRIDRVYVGAALTTSAASTASLIGKECEPMPPSDHYGVRATLHFNSEKPQFLVSPTQSSPWAANAPPNPHYMLALVLDSRKHEKVKAEYDPQSSFPPLHVTLLHGFVEADSGCIDLVKETVQSVLCTLHRTSPPPRYLTFCDRSLDVFEHRASATLVAHPENDSPGDQWLAHLYSALREQFWLCDEQEKHSTSGWSPHVTLGVSGSSAAARALQTILEQDGSWDLDGESMAISSVDVLKRGTTGKFQTIACLPIVPETQPLHDTKCFLSDAGASAGMNMNQLATIALSRLERACRSAAVGSSFNVSVHITGSLFLEAALPGLSDVDAVVKLQPKSESSGDSALASLREAARGNSFLRRVVGALKEENPCAKVRLRSGGNTIILTSRIPGLPSVDLILCLCDKDGTPIDAPSRIVLQSLQDGQAIRDAIPDPFLPAFQGALRIIKLWAHRRDVYGAMTGFLGGGGFAVWLAYFACLDAVDEDPVRGAHDLVKCFFQQASRWQPSKPISLSFLPPDAVSQRCTLSILPPCSDNDFGRSTTPATTLVILQELQSAASFLERRNELCPLLVQRTAAEFIGSNPFVVVLQISSSVAEVGELKAWGSRRFLDMIFDLEQLVGNAGLLRPKARPLRIGREWTTIKTATATGFAWFIGLANDEVRNVVEPYVVHTLTNLSEAAVTDDSIEGIQCDLNILPANDALALLKP